MCDTTDAIFVNGWRSGRTVHPAEVHIVLVLSGVKFPCLAVCVEATRNTAFFGMADILATSIVTAPEVISANHHARIVCGDFAGYNVFHRL
jgi:hypothetical protein